MKHEFTGLTIQCFFRSLFHFILPVGDYVNLRKIFIWLNIVALYTFNIFVVVSVTNAFNIGASWLIENDSLFLTPSYPIFQNEALPGIRLGFIVEKRACDHFKNKLTSILGIARR